MLLADLPVAIARTYAIVLGLFGGSFLNVVIHRVPRGMNIARPASHCPQCGKPLRFYDNVPIVSYAALGGRARCCGAKISPRYPLVELVGGLLAWAILEVLVLPLADGVSVGRGAAIFFTYLVFALALVAVAFIDLEHMYVPDAISIGGTVVGVMTYSLRADVDLVDTLVGAAVGFAVVWLPFSVLYRWIRGRTGMGLGDAKLVMMAGAWFGWSGAIFALLAGAVQGTVAALIVLLAHGRIEEPSSVQKEREETAQILAKLSLEDRAHAEAELRRDPLYEAVPAGSVGLARIAFGPFLALAMLEYLFIGPFVAEYVGWLDPSG
ncbi:MAG TPA: prepilin peptidase [Polyangiaceae bacterium]|nr:prepilin peptidase [Polyangiaceae bacterium]